VGRILVFARRYDEAEAQFIQMLESEETRDLAEDELWMVYWVQGKDERAFELLESTQMFDASPDTLEAVRARFAVGGLRAVFEPMVPDIADLPDEFRGGGVMVAQMNAMVGRYDAALTLLELGLANRAYGKAIPDLVMSPQLDPIRPDERYQAIMGAVGLPVVIPK
jgi:hypothetical protein